MVEANLTRVNFSDVTLDLKSGKHLPYTKEGNIPLYVHRQSNHPPSILRNIPESINKCLSEISSDKECFDKAKSTYQDALNKSGYKYNLSYKLETNPNAPKARRNCQRNVTWFNPPYSQNVETKVGKCFLSLIDHHLPKSKPLHKICNWNILKLSYSCMSSVKSIISRHNRAQIGKPLNPPEEIGTKKSRTTVIAGSRILSHLREIVMCGTLSVYQAEVVTPQSKETYIGLCDTTFKECDRNYTCSFRNERYKNVTELNKYIWSLKDRKINHEIKWQKIRQACLYSHINKKCNLCLIIEPN